MADVELVQTHPHRERYMYIYTDVWDARRLLSSGRRRRWAWCFGCDTVGRVRPLFHTPCLLPIGILFCHAETHPIVVPPPAAPERVQMASTTPPVHPCLFPSQSKPRRLAPIKRRKEEGEDSTHFHQGHDVKGAWRWRCAKECLP